jgi:hypothetical protein
MCIRKLGEQEILEENIRRAEVTFSYDRCLILQDIMKQDAKFIAQLHEEFPPMKEFPTFTWQNHS